MKPPAERGRSPEHIEALETLRYAEATLYRYINDQKVSNGYGDERLAGMPEFQALVADRDDAREAVKAANPKWVTA